MPLELFLAFVAATVVLILIPAPTGAVHVVFSGCPKAPGSDGDPRLISAITGHSGTIHRVWFLPSLALQWPHLGRSPMQRENRRLVAIVAADIAGFSRLIGQNEEGTLRALRAHRQELIDQRIEEYGGRIANTAGSCVALAESPTEAHPRVGSAPQSAIPLEAARPTTHSQEPRPLASRALSRLRGGDGGVDLDPGADRRRSCGFFRVPESPRV